MYDIGSNYMQFSSALDQPSIKYIAMIQIAMFLRMVIKNMA